MDAYQKVKDKLDELSGLNLMWWNTHLPSLSRLLYWRSRRSPTKSMFLTNKKKTQYYLLIMETKTLDMDDFKDREANRIRMSSSESLEKCTTAGTVSPFGLLKEWRKIFPSISIRTLCQRRSWPSIRNTNERPSLSKPKTYSAFRVH